MENLIYILAPIAYFLYQAYQNYQKEQEKARKRNLSDPSTTNAGSVPEVEKVLTKPIIDKRTEAKELTPDYLLTKQEEREKHKKEQLTYERLKAPVTQNRDYYNPETPSEEVVNNRKIHQKHNHGKLEVIAEEEAPAFDLRDAIIKQAILERPFK